MGWIEIMAPVVGLLFAAGVIAAYIWAARREELGWAGLREALASTSKEMAVGIKEKPATLATVKVNGRTRAIHSRKVLEGLAERLRANPGKPLANGVAQDVIHQLLHAETNWDSTFEELSKLQVAECRLRDQLERVAGAMENQDKALRQAEKELEDQDGQIARLGEALRESDESAQQALELLAIARDEVAALRSHLKRMVKARDVACDDLVDAMEEIGRLKGAAMLGEVPVAEFSGDAEAGPPDLSLSPFRAALEELGELHDRKQADYGKEGDPFANVRASEGFGIPAWLGAIVRGNDKVARIQAFAKKGTLANESVEDSIKDLAVYAVIALVLYRQAQQNQGDSDSLADSFNKVA